MLDQPASQTPGARTLSEELARKVGLWDGLCEISCALEPESLNVDSTAAVTIGRIVEEGISNAIRHGKASSIQIRITRVDESLVQITVSDNGLGPQHGRASVGSAYVQQASANRWSLTATSPGSRLEALVSA